MPFSSSPYQNSYLNLWILFSDWNQFSTLFHTVLIRLPRREGKLFKYIFHILSSSITFVMPLFDDNITSEVLWLLYKEAQYVFCSLTMIDVPKYSMAWDLSVQPSKRNGSSCTVGLINYPCLES